MHAIGRQPQRALDGALVHYERHRAQPRRHVDQPPCAQVPGAVLALPQPGHRKQARAQERGALALALALAHVAPDDEVDAAGWSSRVTKTTSLAVQTTLFGPVGQPGPALDALIAALPRRPPRLWPRSRPAAPSVRECAAPTPAAALAAQPGRLRAAWRAAPGCARSGGCGRGLRWLRACMAGEGDGRARCAARCCGPGADHASCRRRAEKVRKPGIEVRRALEVRQSPRRINRERPVLPRAPGHHAAVVGEVAAHAVAHPNGLSQCVVHIVDVGAEEARAQEVQGCVACAGLLG